MKIKPIPKHLEHEKLKGICCNACVEGGVGSRFRAKAHAHINGEWKGWICFLSEKRLNQKKLGLHELAHIISEEGHTDKFRQVCKEIGVSIKKGRGLKSYEKKKKKVQNV